MSIQQKPKIDPLAKSNAHFARLRGQDLFQRTQSYAEWISARQEQGFWPYSRQLSGAPTPEARIGYLDREVRPGINLAVQDYLGLSCHPEIREAAIRAITDVGVHSAGSPMLLGNSAYSLALERRLTQLVELDHVLLFPTGWSAGFGVIKALIREYDHIVMDALSHACLQEGAAAATKNIIRFEHLNCEKAEGAIRKIRENDAENAILVVTEGVFSMDSDTPEIARLQEICSVHGARLLVDLAHDLGALGPNGKGQLELQEMVGKVDLVMGAFSKTFASNGGFVATNDFRIKQYLRWFASPHTFSNALSPVQCAVVSKAIDIVTSVEGAALRQDLIRAAMQFRHGLQIRGLEPLGAPTAIVPIVIGGERIARRASSELAESGVFANLVEFPAVALKAARFRCQLMATHTEQQLNMAAEQIAGAIARAELTEATTEQVAELAGSYRRDSVTGISEVRDDKVGPAVLA